MLPETDKQLSTVKEGKSNFGGIRFVIGKDKDRMPQAVIVKKGEIKEISLLNNVKLINPEAERRFMASQVDLGGLFLSKVSELYLLHTAIGIGKGETAAGYSIYYEDGKEVKLDVTEGVNIGRIEGDKDFEVANYVGNGLYLTKWTNPYPEKKLKKITIKGGDKGRYVLLGITGTLIREKLHD